MMAPPTARSSSIRAGRRQALRLMPADGDLDAFVAAVADHRGRPIMIRAWPYAADEPSGYLYGLDEHDIVVMDAVASPSQRAGVLCHELAHLVLGHQGSAADSRLVEALLGPDLNHSARLRTGLLLRHDFEAGIEADAEMLGTILVAETRRRARRADLDADPMGMRVR